MNECTGGVPRLGAQAVVAVALVALTGCGSFGTPAPLDARFAASVRADGFAVPPGENESVLIAAADKICDRRREQGSLDERRGAALTRRELAAATQTFAGDPAAVRCSRARHLLPDLRAGA